MAGEVNTQTTGNTVSGQDGTAQGQEKTFTQSEVDVLIGSRLAREREKYPTDEELAAYRTWKDSQQTEQEKQAKQAKELNDSKNALSAAQSEIQQLKRERYVLSKGLSGDEAEFIAFKAGKLVNDKTTFEQAVDSLTKDKKKTTFDWTVSVGETVSV